MSIHVRPQFVICGFPADPRLVDCRPGQVMIVASTKLAHGELKYTTDRPYRQDFTDVQDMLRHFRMHWDLLVELADFVVVVADTYPEAFALLLRDWSPDVQQPAITAPRPAIASPQPREIEP